MERAISDEEKIRRAEEIYNRRRNQNSNNNRLYTTVNVSGRKDYKLLKKLFIQIVLCILIYIGMYTVQNGDYIFSEEVKNQAKQVLSYDINFQSITERVISYINEIKNKNALIPEENKEKENNTNEPTTEEQNTIDSNTVSEGANAVLGAIDEPLYTEETSSISQVQIDADYIKENYSLIKPLNGTITSRFGTRNPTTETVPKYHTGIDIAASVGTVIVAAMEGEVTLVSSAGDYRESFKNTKWRSSYFICSL